MGFPIRLVVLTGLVLFAVGYFFSGFDGPAIATLNTGDLKTRLFGGKAVTTLDVGKLKARIAAAGKNGRPVRSVLFIGNSHTYVNNVPALLEGIAESHPENRHDYVVSTIAQGGAQLSRFSQNPKVEQVLTQIDWDYVVLQNQSGAALHPSTLEPFFQAVEWFESQLDPFKSNLILYATWPWNLGHEYYADQWAQVSTPEQMNGVTEQSYRSAAAQYGARTAPVGSCWLSFSDPDLLYQSDGNHATPEGSFLAALVLFGAIAELAPDQTTYVPWLISDETAGRLRAKAGAC